MMTDKFLINILKKCGITVKWYTDQYSPQGYGYLYFLDGDNQIDEATAMELVEKYLVSAIASRLETGKVEF